MSKLKVSTISDPDNDNTAISIDSSGNATFSQDVTFSGAINGDGSSLTGISSGSNPNLIINGAMQINQRGWTSAAVVNAFTVDRWKVTEQTDGAITAEQSTDAPDGFGNSLKVTVTSADASLGATQYARIQQNIEGTNIVGLAFGTASAKTITISFYVKSSLTGTFSGCIRAINVNRSYPFTYTISSANTWEAKSVTISGDTGGAWDLSTSGGVSLFLTLCSGSDYDAPAGAWETTGSSAAEGCVNVLGTNGATIQWTGVKLEVGSVATPFEHRSYGEELALCERYYWRAPEGNTYALKGVGYANSSSGHHIYIQFGTTMRTQPTFSYSGSFEIIQQSGSPDVSSISGIDITTKGARLDCATASANAGQPSILRDNNDAAAYLAFDAEL